MKKIALPLLIFLFVSKGVFSQKELALTVIDTSTQKPVVGATVSILGGQDSILLVFGYTDNGGSFKFSNLKDKKYVLLISSTGYVDYADIIALKSATLTDLGKVILTPKAKLLEEVVVRQKIAAIRIRGDTTEYIADSFRLHKNATVEELLRNLPGIQVDKKGNISAQGKEIKKVLVDGEEFFGDDPTIVTRNFRASMVDKVQVYDKRSDNLTDVTEAEKQKVIDLKLKEDSKNGRFGKITLGGGFDKVYENQAMLNYFKNKKKVSVYGTLSNTGVIGLSSKDNEKYNTGIDQTITGDVDLDSWGGSYTGQGIPKAISGGFHFSNRWNADRQYVNLNYKISDITVSGNNNTISQNTLADNILYTKSQQVFNNNILRNIANAKYDINVDKTFSIKTEVSGALNHKTTENFYNTENRDANSELLNAGTRNIKNVSDFNAFNISTRLEKALKKKGRVVALDIRDKYLDQNSSGNLYSHYQFFKETGNSDSILTVDQFKKNQMESNYFDAKATYIEPLSSSTFLSAKYNFLVSQSRMNINTYNRSIGGAYDMLDSAFSNDFDYSRITHRGGLTLLYTKNKIRFNVGTDLSTMNFDQQNRFTQSRVSRNFFNFYPQAELIYTFKLQKSMSVKYSGNVIQPTINQIQPVANNADPLNVYIGNSSLTPYYSNSVYVTYNSYKPANKQYFFSNASYSFSQNPIGLNVTTDVTTGQATYLYMNIPDGNSFSYNSYIGIGKNFQKLGDIYGGANFNINGGRNVIITNGKRNNLISGVYSLSAYINKSKKDVYNIGLNGGTSYNVNVMSLQTGAQANYWIFQVSPSFNLYFPGVLEFSTDFDYTKRQKTRTFNNNLDIFLLNFSLGKRFGKLDSWFLKFAGKDLLNQNKGFSRNISNSLITESTYTTIGRYFLLSLTWDFNSNNVKK
ncbi:outer membrane beta-barrel protein [Niabella sp.]|uniref:outer membrane beta-barrel protein n=1 Tax=Niabella sp. TaxID=1962976 RepID=UPI0026270FB4|nr:outer membrane beta-barrel protein [Niabella sp.]